MRHAERGRRQVLLQLRTEPGGPAAGAPRGTARLSDQLDAPAIPPLPSLPAARQPAVDAGLAAILTADPAFDRFGFLEMAKTRFAAVKQALQAWQPEAAQALMTPGLYGSWAAGVQTQEEQRVRNVFDDLQVGDPQVMWVVPGPAVQHITVQLNALAMHFAASEASRQILFGDPQHLRPLTEYWTFSRPASARTAAPGSAAQCPFCGAPIAAGATACPYCKAAITAAGGAWLISRMDEELIWSDDVTSVG